MALRRIVVLAVVCLVALAVADTTVATKKTSAAATTTAAKKATTPKPSTPKPTTTAKKATTPKPSTPKPTTTTPAPPINILTGTMDLEVTDVVEFLRDTKVVAPIVEAMAELLALDKKQVELYAISQLSIDTTTTPAATKKVSRRMAATPGKVKANFKITDPKNKVTPAQVQKIAPKLPGKANPKLPAGAKIGKAVVPLPKQVKKPADPCAPVVTPAPVVVAPVNPCAPAVPAAPAAPAVSPCAVVGVGVKDEVRNDEKASITAAASGFSPMFLLAVPALIGMVALARNIKKRFAQPAVAVVDEETGCMAARDAAFA